MEVTSYTFLTVVLDEWELSALGLGRLMEEYRQNCWFVFDTAVCSTYT